MKLRAEIIRGFAQQVLKEQTLTQETEDKYFNMLSDFIEASISFQAKQEAIEKFTKKLHSAIKYAMEEP